MLKKSIYIYRYQRRTTMSPIYFGFALSNRGTSKLAVKTDQGEIGPAEPSRFIIYVNAVMSPTYRLLVGCLGLAVSIPSFLVGSYTHSASEGLMANSTGENFIDLLPRCCGCHSKRNFPPSIKHQP